MKTSLTPLLLAVACIPIACGWSRPEPQRRMATHAATSVSVTDTSWIQEFEQTHHAVLDTVLAANRQFAVAAARRSAGVSLVTLARDSLGGRQIGPDMPIDHLSFPAVRLVELDPRTALRVVTFNNLPEDVVGTAVDRLRLDGIRREYADSSDRCKAADFTDKDGGYTLRQYLESPFANDCLAPCAEALRRVMGIEPAYVVTLQRTGDAWARTKPGTDVNGIVKGYIAGARALDSGKVPECVPDSARLVELLNAWQRQVRAQNENGAEQQR